MATCSLILLIKLLRRMKITIKDCFISDYVLKMNFYKVFV